MTKDVIPRIAVNDSIKIGQEYMKVTTLSADKKTLTVTRALAPEGFITGPADSAVAGHANTKVTRVAYVAQIQYPWRRPGH